MAVIMDLILYFFEITYGNETGIQKNTALFNQGCLTDQKIDTSRRPYQPLTT